MARGGSALWLGDHGFSCELVLLSREDQLTALLKESARAGGTANPDVRSPMPGTVVSVEVAAGDSVTAGQVLLTVEAMKMEHKLLAAVDGVVNLSITPGELVKLDQIVATITPPPQAHPTKE